MGERVFFSLLFDEATHATEKVVLSLDQGLGYWRKTHQHWFGPGELVVHLAQAERFNISWIKQALRGNGEITLPPVFDPIRAETNLCEKWNQLRVLNLVAARTKLEEFDTVTELHRWWKESRTATEIALQQITPDKLDAPIQHPLDPSIEGPCLVVCAQLFIGHTYYHCGQVTQQMKKICTHYKAPVIIGDMAIPAYVRS